MPVFEYSGFDASGTATAGIIDADNAKVARARLRRQGLFPTEVKEQSQEGPTRGKGLSIEVDLSRYLQFVSARDVSTLTNQLATLIGASIPMAEALAALVEQTEKTKLKVILSQVKERVNEGSTLADALADHPRIFDTLFVQMVRAGEKTGSLDKVLKRLAKFTDSQVKLQGKLFAALAYPVMMSIVGVLILTGLFMGVIPRIRGLFASMGGEEALPLITRVVFAFGDLLTSRWVFVVIGALVVIAWGLRRYVNTESGRVRFDRFKLTMPIFGKMNRLTAISRFCRTLATLLVSGVPIVTALDIVRDVVGNVILADAVQAATRNIQEGQPIAVPLRTSGQFPPMVTHMIAIGERTGELEPMLTAVADDYEEQVETTLAALTSMLAPAAIIALGGAVFLVALGMLLPMLNLSSMMAG